MELEQADFISLSPVTDIMGGEIFFFFNDVFGPVLRIRM